MFEWSILVLFVGLESTYLSLFCRIVGKAILITRKAIRNKVISLIQKRGCRGNELEIGEEKEFAVVQVIYLCASQFWRKWILLFELLQYQRDETHALRNMQQGNEWSRKKKCSEIGIHFHLLMNTDFLKYGQFLNLIINIQFLFLVVFVMRPVFRLCSNVPWVASSFFLNFKFLIMGSYLRTFRFRGRCFSMLSAGEKEPKKTNFVGRLS